MTNDPTSNDAQDATPDGDIQASDIPANDTQDAAAPTPAAPSDGTDSPTPSADSATDKQADGASSMAQRVAAGQNKPVIGNRPSGQPRVGGRSIPNVPKGPVAVPSKRLNAENPDLDREVAAALGEMSVDDIMSETTAAQPGVPLESDERYRASVVRIHGDNVFFSINGSNEGVASLRQFDDPPEIGAQIDIIVRGMNDGIYEVSVPGASIAVADWDDIEEGAIVEATITASNTGGLECTINRLRGFIPASQVAMYRIEDFSEFVGQKVLCVVTEANPQRRNLVLSRRAVLEREKEENKQKLMAELEVGQQREGVVRKLMDFGAFVDLGGVDGLIHISKLSWDRIKHPSEVLEEGQNVKVNIDKLDPETGKISLSYRSETDHPWKDIEAQFPVNSVAKGTVSRVANFGAFVKLAVGVEGLVHISELAHHRVTRVGSVVKEGEPVEVRILSVDPDEQRISLSIKAAQAKADGVDSGEAEEEEEIVQESAVKDKHTGPLRGGTDRPSGGDQFGLKW